jgi:CheY-like chemotaxis protein
VIPESLTAAAGSAAHPSPDGLQVNDEEVSLSGVRVLLVEDHDVTRRAVAQLLADAGAIVSQARTGREGMHLLAHGPHHVMLLDLMLPDIDGAELLRDLQMHRPRELRCIMVISGDVREAREAEVKQLGACELIPKPVSAPHLLKSIARNCLPLQEDSRRTGSSATAARSVREIL